ncbi:Methylated-DNA-binding protein3 [Madurella fahalii]|uniref:Methylated-DNA-binding protein3 n=1 Tax=Madurella fahalii TaxID=1157608 RepID=A0ABQ0G091_9PEZI
MSSSPAAPSMLAKPEQAPADELLQGFDIRDEEARDFLSSLVSSRKAPQAELDELQHLSLMRGVEEWDMLFACAESLRERSGASRKGSSSTRLETSLVPFLGDVLAGRGVRLLGTDSALCQPGKGKRKVERDEMAKEEGKARKATGKGVSHFWGGPEPEGGSEEKVKSIRQTAGHSRVLSRETAACSPSTRNRGTSHVKDEAVPDPSLAQNQSPSVPSGHSLPNTTACSDNYRKGDTERPVKAKGTSRSPFFSTLTPPGDKLSPNPTPSPTNPPSNKRKPRPPRGTVSSLPIPPLSAARFGLIQEELAADPFRLLIAVTFLIRTAGRAAIPVFRELMARFPSPAALAAPAAAPEIVARIRPLGLSAVRCAAIQRYARLWLARLPTRLVRYAVKNYPLPGDGRGVRAGEVFGPEDDDRPDRNGDADGEGEREGDAVADARQRGVGCAWEIGHLTQGPYALDSWRIFCRDVLLGRSAHWTGEGSEPGFQPEWMRVLPMDKELRACLRWMWMREGWEWDPLTGEREPLRDEMRMAVEMGRVGYDDRGNLVILDQVAGDVG